ncbi:hypothetical protein RJT34_18025 [Clitoria ternatea]|uniref:Uncharacterized protein n=1 Tax=Clitoria ternatea TaxID=43366 RepID=A0AAN9JBC0_CLITE
MIRGAFFLVLACRRANTANSVYMLLFFMTPGCLHTLVARLRANPRAFPCQARFETWPISLHIGTLGSLPCCDEAAKIELIKIRGTKGTPKNKECAAAVLLELCLNNSSFILAALQFGVYEHLIEIEQCGTDRAQRKANAILELISRNEQISAFSNLDISLFLHSELKEYVDVQSTVE